MEKKNVRVAIILISIIGACLIGCLGIGLAVRFAPNIYQYNLENSSLKVGDAAPDFELMSLEDETVRLSQFKGQSVLLSIDTMPASASFRMLTIWLSVYFDFFM